MMPALQWVHTWTSIPVVILITSAKDSFCFGAGWACLSAFLTKFLNKNRNYAIVQTKPKKPNELKFSRNLTLKIKNMC